MVQHAAFLGHEIGLHTVTHTTGGGTTQLGWAKELGLSRKYIEAFSNVPRRSINGTRAPFLMFNRNMFLSAQNEGLGYDSSMWEYYRFVSHATFYTRCFAP